MLVLKLCNQVCPDKVKFNLFNKLGDGADGEVFELEDNKVIKFCVQFDYGYPSLKDSYQKISKTLSYIQYNKPPVYARVYEYDYLGKYDREVFGTDKKQEYILYYYIMERLVGISEDEKKVFHSLLSHEDRGIFKNYSILKIKKMLEGMQLGLDFDMGRVIFFCEKLMQSSIIHNDLHPRNIMKDKDGNFKLIDFDRCTIKI
jgi:serine/threonine protein kinase